MSINETPVSGMPIKRKEEGANHVARIDGHLARVFRRHGFEGVTTQTPLQSLIENEESANREKSEGDAEETQEQRQQILRKLLRFCFADGPHPGKVMRRTYALARAYDPALIAEMNGSDLAVIFDETRAAQSARLKLMFDGYLKKSGAKGNRLPCQKRASSTAKYAAAAKGNQNRKGKKVASLAKDSRRRVQQTAKN